jgi:hypothetical protein
MRRIPTFFEIVLSVVLLVAGLILLHAASSSQSTGQEAYLLGGAVCLTLGVLTTISSIKSILWHRRMVRHSARPGLHPAIRH